jgi:hypothetical protein
VVVTVMMFAELGAADYVGRRDAGMYAQRHIRVGDLPIVVHCGDRLGCEVKLSGFGQAAYSGSPGMSVDSVRGEPNLGYGIGSRQ